MQIFGQEDMRRIAKKFNLEILDIVFLRDRTACLPQGLNNFHSHSAILMFLVTDNVKWRFCVRFTPAISHDESSLEYSSFTRGRGGGQKSLVCLKSTVSIGISGYLYSLRRGSRGVIMWRKGGDG